MVWHPLDVGSSHPGAGVGPKGWAVRPLKRHELGLERRETVRSLSAARAELEKAVPSTRGRDGRTSTIMPVVLPRARLVGYVRK